MKRRYNRANKNVFGWLRNGSCPTDGWVTQIPKQWLQTVEPTSSRRRENQTSCDDYVVQSVDGQRQIADDGDRQRRRPPDAIISEVSWCLTPWKQRWTVTASLFCSRWSTSGQWYLLMSEMRCAAASNTVTRQRDAVRCRGQNQVRSTKNDCERPVRKICSEPLEHNMKTKPVLKTRQQKVMIEVNSLR